MAKDAMKNSNSGQSGKKTAVPAKSLTSSDLENQLQRTTSKLQQTEMLLSVTRKIAGLKNLSEILWALIAMTTDE